MLSLTLAVKPGFARLGVRRSLVNQADVIWREWGG